MKAAELRNIALSPSWCTRSKPRFTFWRTKLLPEPISSRCDGLDEAVVAPRQLVLQHLRVLHPDGVKVCLLYTSDSAGLEVSVSSSTL